MVISECSSIGSSFADKDILISSVSSCKLSSRVVFSHAEATEIASILTLAEVAVHVCTPSVRIKWSDIILDVMGQFDFTE